ncbi:tyrosine-type recombinase/integrase [Paenibacillus sp. BSR1-1]|uniref:tyrosine-type recombinase/integrase n=1 Tax=Paenibacillus sp. BSR1-1 TaxID=3020845 RepID=UPI0025AF1083|nr:tyrosine-type recombinase/integrase [Paenibacillus sp. BSR1-1]MDN3015780.1 tyrosine-type recombinase/integrase [Paenibacillus sp. BSR1-1]
MIEQFEKYLHQEDLSENTRSSYVQHAKGFLKWFEESKGTEFKQLHRENVKDYISYLRTIKKSSPKTINAKISALIKLNEFLMDSKVQNDYAVSKKDNLKIQQQYASLARIDVKDVERFRQLLLDHEKSKRNHSIITLMAYAGLRISEALEIKMMDFNLVSRELLIKGKGDKARTVFMSDKVITALKEWLKERKALDSDYLFISNRGSNLNRTVINNLFTTYSKQLGKDITPHDLRHFFCSHAISKGMSVHEVANHAGHSNIHTTLLYTNPSKTELIDKMNQL